METIVIGVILIVLIVFGSVKDYRYDQKTKGLMNQIKIEKEIVHRESNKTNTFSKL